MNSQQAAQKMPRTDVASLLEDTELQRRKKRKDKYKRIAPEAPPEDQLLPPLDHPSEPLDPLAFGGNERLLLESEDEWDVQRLKEGVKEICFGLGFSVKSAHLQAIADAPEAFRTNLRSIHLRDSRRLLDSDILVLVQGCPSLTHIVILHAIYLTNGSLSFIAKSCQGILFLSFTGVHVREAKSKFLKTLIKFPELAASLRRIRLPYQGCKSNAMKKLSLARKELEVVEGKRLDGKAEKSHYARMKGGGTWKGGRFRFDKEGKS